MNIPKISIVVPVYKTEKYLHKCVDSLLSQTFTDFEILLIDDGSPDHSGEICDEYAKNDSRVRVFHKENGGVSTARNIGIDKAQGEWLTFVDSDDWVEPNYCETLIQNVGDADIMYFSEIFHYKDGCCNVFSAVENVLVVNNRLAIEENILHLIRNGAHHNYFGYTWNKIFRASIIKDNDIRFVEGLSVSEDEVFSMDFCMYATCLKLLNAPLYNYRRALNDGLTMRRKKPEEFLMLADCFVKVIESLSYSSLITLEKLRVTNFLSNAFNSTNGFIPKIKAFQIIRKFCKKHSLFMPWKSLIKGFMINIIR